MFLGNYIVASFLRAFIEQKVLWIISTLIVGVLESLGGHRYFVYFIDDYSRMTWLFIMKSKGEAFKNFKQWKALVEN